MLLQNLHHTCLSPISVSNFWIQFSTSVSILYFRYTKGKELCSTIVHKMIQKLMRLDVSNKHPSPKSTHPWTTKRKWSPWALNQIITAHNTTRTGQPLVVWLKGSLGLTQDLSLPFFFVGPECVQSLKRDIATHPSVCIACLLIKPITSYLFFKYLNLSSQDLDKLPKKSSHMW